MKTTNKILAAALAGMLMGGAAFAEDKPAGDAKAEKPAKAKKGAKKGDKAEDKHKGGEKSCGADGKSCKSAK